MMKPIYKHLLTATALSALSIGVMFGGIARGDEVYGTTTSGVNGTAIAGDPVTEFAARRKHRRAIDANGNHIADPRPARWCGYWLRHHLGVADRALNLARNWARYGSPAGGPVIGAVVVWNHHVGIITGKTATGWIVKSGNDGHAVRERERSVKGAIAFRLPGSNQFSARRTSDAMN